MDPLVAPLAAKILEQIDNTDRLLTSVPVGAGEWRPPGARPLRTVDELVVHLADCVAGFLAVLIRMRPREMAAVDRFRTMPPPAGPVEVRSRIAAYRREIVDGVELLNTRDLVTDVPTVFVPEGEPAMTLLLGNLEHLINHKHQLFFYLRLLGVDIGTPDLYRLRGPA